MINLTQDEEYVIERMRASEPYATFRIEKQGGKLVFIIVEDKIKIVLENKT